MFKNLFLGNTNIDFYKKRSLLQRILLVEILIFLIVLILTVIGILNLNFSIDFTGGTTYQLSSDYTKSDIDEVLNNNILEVSRYQTYENSNTVLFRAVEGSQSQESELLNYLANKFDVESKDIEFQRVGPTFGQEITTKGIRALVIFLSFIVFLISIRFQFRFSLIALIALIHDLLICITIYLLLNFEITPSTVIALLTILGYSLYDTVILFDKLRDSQRMNKESNLSIKTLNKTFNEILMRSINTSITSAIPIASILFLGNIIGLSGTLTDFALPLFIGILSGTYSSIFVTIPFLSRIINK
tara:strand:- start:1087 stop:1992 length:906 start_codon:yes stop_codon:yes gene_type:complete